MKRLQFSIPLFLVFVGLIFLSGCRPDEADNTENLIQNFRTNSQGSWRVESAVANYLDSLITLELEQDWIIDFIPDSVHTQFPTVYDQVPYTPFFLLETPAIYEVEPDSDVVLVLLGSYIGKFRILDYRGDEMDIEWVMQTVSPYIHWDIHLVRID